jgi:cell division protein FtsZ
MVLLVAGLGGVTGTGAIPVVARAAGLNRALTIALVTRPFFFEGKRRLQAAEWGINELITEVDALIDIRPEDYWLCGLSLPGAFSKFQRILCAGVKTFIELATEDGIISVDFADMKAVLEEAGALRMAMGEDDSRNQAIVAAGDAILGLESIGSPQWLICNVTMGGHCSSFDLEDIFTQINRNISRNTRTIIRVGTNREFGTGTRATAMAPDGGSLRKLHQAAANPILDAGDFRPNTQDR